MPWGETIWKLEGGKWVSCCDKARYERMAGIRFPRERWSAVVAAMEYQSAWWKTKKKHRRRCITSASFEKAFLMAVVVPPRWRIFVLGIGSFFRRPYRWFSFRTLLSFVHYFLLYATFHTWDTCWSLRMCQL